MWISDQVTRVYFESEGFLETSVYLMESLGPGHRLAGPAIIMDRLSTVLVEPGCEAAITDNGDVRITVGSANARAVGTELDTIQLSIFSHRSADGFHCFTTSSFPISAV